MNTPKRLEWTVTEKVPCTHDIYGNPILNSAGEPLPFTPMIEVTRIRPEVLKTHGECTLSMNDCRVWIHNE